MPHPVNIDHSLDEKCDLSRDIEKDGFSPLPDRSPPASCLLSPFQPSDSPTVLMKMLRVFAILVLLSVAGLVLSFPTGPSFHLPFLLDRQVADTVASTSQSQTTSAAYEPAFTAPSAFPTSAFASYYFNPTGLTAEPRPAVTDVARNSHYPDVLGNPTVYPPGPAATDAVFPKAAKGPAPPANFVDAIVSNITSLFDDEETTMSKCDKCRSALRIAQQIAKRQPKAAPQVMVDLCKRYKFKADHDCEQLYRPEVLASEYTQVLSYADFDSPTSTDAQYICSIVVGASVSNCSLPAPRSLDDEFLDDWFGGKRQAPASHPKKAGKPLKDGGHLRVLHMSDIHVDPRFFVGGEAACTNGRCCRSDAYNKTLVMQPNFVPGTLPKANISEESVYWGNYKCDTPWALVLAAFESIKTLNGGKDVDMTLYTGDMVVHDLPQYVSKDLVTYTQQSIFDLMKKYLGNGPVFNAIGNHDSAPSDSAAQLALPDGRGQQFSWDWDNCARLFEAEGWFDRDEAEQVRRHYAGYSVTPRKGLRIITLNTDFWYRANIFNMIHTQNPDYSGTLRFLTDELFHAERRGERVWIVGHVLTGWDGSNPLDNPTNLFYQIVDRFAPHTIAHIFFGHTHEDQFNLFYANNATSKTSRDALAVSFMAPSVTPGNNVNPALRFLDVDPETYEVMDWHQYFAEVPEFPDLPETGHGPVFRHLYSAREAYGNFSASKAAGTYTAPVQLDQQGRWPADAPLNATFWSALTEEMEARPELVQTFTVYQGRNSPRSPACTSAECIKAKICYMRSGSAIIGKQCPTGFGSVQS